MNGITYQRRRECFEDITKAQRAISDASFTLGEGNEHLRHVMVEAQVLLASLVTGLWNLPIEDEGSNKS